MNPREAFEQYRLIAMTGVGLILILGLAIVLSYLSILLDLFRTRGFLIALLAFLIPPYFIWYVFARYKDENRKIRRRVFLGGMAIFVTSVAAFSTVIFLSVKTDSVETDQVKRLAESTGMVSCQKRLKVEYSKDTRTHWLDCNITKAFVVPPELIVDNVINPTKLVDYMLNDVFGAVGKSYGDIVQQKPLRLVIQTHLGAAGDSCHLFEKGNDGKVHLEGWIDREVKDKRNCSVKR